MITINDMTMKKEYIIPETQVVLLNMQQHLLTGSQGDVVDGDINVPGGEQLAPSFDSWDDFDIEDEGFDYSDDYASF